MEKGAFRITVYIPDELAERLDKIKKEAYYNKSKAEMLRDMIAIGIDKYEAENNIGGNT